MKSEQQHSLEHWHSKWQRELDRVETDLQPYYALLLRKEFVETQLERIERRLGEAALTAIPHLHLVPGGPDVA